MEGKISNFCQGRHHKSGNQLIVVVAGLDNRDKAAKLVGKKVTFDTGKKLITGEVRSAHGNSGALRVLFETGMPGQCISQQVKIE